MAKGLGVTGNARKKLGNLVFYTLKNSNNAQTQGIRQYQPVVTNPKSDAQSAQRMKLTPLQVFYESFNDVLDHSFEGKKVGQMNRQRFMQLNMSVTSGEAPAVQKGERLLAPIKAQVASGSIAIDTTCTPVADNNGALLTSLNLGSADTDIEVMTVGAFSRELIANNLGLVDGMEVAVIAVIAREDNPRYGIPVKFFVVLDSTDNVTLVESILDTINGSIALTRDASKGVIALSCALDGYKLLGAAVIVSKKNTKSWAVSNSRFVPTAYGEGIFYTNDLYRLALASYGPNGSTLESDLFLRQADNNSAASDPQAVTEVTAVPIQLKPEFAGGTLSSTSAAAVELRSGVTALVVSDGDVLQNPNGGIVTITTTVDGNNVTRPLKISATTFEGARTVAVGSF